MGAAAVTPLRDALTSDQVIVRREALRSLGKLRERASLDPQIVIPSLLTALTDPEPSVGRSPSPISASCGTILAKRFPGWSTRCATPRHP